MRSKPIISVARTVEVFQEALSCRRDYAADDEFFRMTDFWDYLCDEEGRWAIKKYRSDRPGDFDRRPSVVSIGDRATLTVDERLWELASRGDGFTNFTLAHEAGHLGLGHHARSAALRNFQRLTPGPRGMLIKPPTLEELEANYFGVFLQCGVALMEPRWTAIGLASRAFSDAGYVKKAQMAVRLDEFQRLLNRPKPKRERVIL